MLPATILQASRSRQAFDLRGELSNDGAPSIEETHLLVHVAISRGLVHHMRGILRAALMVLQGDDRSHERLLCRSPAGQQSVREDDLLLVLDGQKARVQMRDEVAALFADQRD